MRRLVLALIFGVLSLSALAEELRFDGSSPEAFKASAQAILAQATPEQKKQFSIFGILFMRSVSDLPEEERGVRLRAALDGLTIEEAPLTLLK